VTPVPDQGLRAFERFFANPTIREDDDLKPLLSKIIHGILEYAS
jgi:hypothetical protein